MAVDDPPNYCSNPGCRIFALRSSVWQRSTPLPTSVLTCLPKKIEEAHDQGPFRPCQELTFEIAVKSPERILASVRLGLDG